MLLGKYYVQIKDAHIHWGERRKTSSRSIRKNESYIAIPSSYAYLYKILKGTVYQCTWDNGEKCELKAAGSQSKREFAKQFQGNGSLKIVYDWYKYHNAKEGDYAVISIYDNQYLRIEYVSNVDVKKKNRLHILGENGKVQESIVESDISFRLKSLIVKDGEVVHCNICFISDELKDVVEEPVVSLIIGANGSGKSFILKILADIFNATQNTNALSQLKYSYYELKYFLDGELVELQIINKQIVIHRNGVLQEENESLLNKVLAVSFMINDKFPFKQVNDQETIYEYLGIRMTSNASWTSSMSAKLADSLLDLAIKDRIWKFLSDLSRFLNVESKISISFEMSTNDFFSDDLFNLLKKNGERIAAKEDYRSEAIRNYDDGTYQMLYEMLSNIRKNNQYTEDKNKVLLGFEIDTQTSKTEMQKVSNDYKRIKLLSSLQIINNMTLNLYKNDKRYSFEESSSGEKHILYSFTNIYNSIQSNSLILIDEPEISLHPNWQIKYISFLKEVFKQYKTCHFVIASHSHYMVSDLNPKSSSLIVAEIDDKGKKNYETIDYSTYAWSAENILYNVFGVRTYRNYYFDTDVRELLYMVTQNKKEEMDRINQLYNKLKKYVLDENDPLKQVIEQVGNYIRDVESK